MSDHRWQVFGFVTTWPWTDVNAECQIPGCKEQLSGEQIEAILNAHEGVVAAAEGLLVALRTEALRMEWWDYSEFDDLEQKLKRYREVAG